MLISLATSIVITADLRQRDAVSSLAVISLQTVSEQTTRWLLTLTLQRKTTKTSQGGWESWGWNVPPSKETLDSAELTSHGAVLIAAHNLSAKMQKLQHKARQGGSWKPCGLMATVEGDLQVGTTPGQRHKKQS